MNKRGKKEKVKKKSTKMTEQGRKEIKQGQVGRGGVKKKYNEGRTRKRERRE